MRAAFAVVVWLSGTFGQSVVVPGVNQIINNDRVTVWHVTWTNGRSAPMPGSQYDTAMVYLAGGKTVGEVVFTSKGARQHDVDSTRGRTGRVVVIGFKDHPAPPLPNTTGYKDAFDRPGIKKLFENHRATVFDYTWTQGVPTPMHFHGTDVVAVYTEDGAIKSTTTDGRTAVQDIYPGKATWNARDRIHTEELVKGKGRAIIVELK